MKIASRTAVWSALTITGLLLTGLLAGCSGGSTDSNVVVPSGYRFEGVLVKDLSKNVTNTSSRLTLDGKAVSAANITFSDDTLQFSGSPDSLYTKTQASASFYSVGAANLVVLDGKELSDTVPATVIDTFSISFIDPTFGFWRPSDGNVFMQWTAVSNIDGYVWAVVKADLAYQGKGFSGYVDVQAGPNATIVPDVFNINIGAGTVIDTGWHYLYVYAYSGSPDQALSSTLLPVPLPSQKADNIKKSNFVGRFGSVTVTRSDSLLVTQI